MRVVGRFGALIVALLVGAAVWLVPQVIPDIDLETSRLPSEGGFEIAGGRRGRAVVTIDWTEVRPGMVFAVDSRAFSPLGGAVWLVDPDSDSVVGEISTGANPEAVLSSDGTRIFILSRSVTAEGKPVEVVSSVFLGTGEVAWETEAIWPDSVRSRERSAIALSGNGATVYVTAIGRALDDPASPRLVAINAFSGERVASFSAPGDCGRDTPKLASGPARSTVLVLCQHLATVHFVDIEIDGPGISGEIDWSEEYRGTSFSIGTDDGHESIFVTQADGLVTELDATSLAFVRRLDPGLGVRSIQSISRSRPTVLDDGGLLAVPLDHRGECSVSRLDQPLTDAADIDPSSCALAFVDLASAEPRLLTIDRPISALADQPSREGFLVVDGQSGVIARYDWDGSPQTAIDVGTSLNGLLIAG